MNTPDMINGAHAAFVKRSGGGWEAVAFFRSLKYPNARTSCRSTSWARTREGALESLRVMCK